MTLPESVFMADAATLAAHLVAEVGSVSAAAVVSRGAWSLAIPGGSVVDAFLPALARADLPWDRAHLFQCDERVVPPGDVRSNWEALQRLGEVTARLHGTTLHRMPVEQGDDAVGAYTARLEQVGGRPPALDVVLLGMGEDGHVASLFPGRAALEVEDAAVVIEPDAPKPPPRRLSLTMPVLAAASLTVVAAFGTAKAVAARAAFDATSDLPVARLLRRARRSLVLLDHDAAALVRGGRPHYRRSAFGGPLAFRCPCPSHCVVRSWLQGASRSALSR